MGDVLDRNMSVSPCALACENIRFSALFAAGTFRAKERFPGTFTTQRQKFHTVDENQCLHNKSGSHGVPNINLSHFTSLIVDFATVLCSSANEFQQNSNASSNASSRKDCYVVFELFVSKYLSGVPVN